MLNLKINRLSPNLEAVYFICTSTNKGFCNIGAEAIPISIGSLLGCGSGRSFSIIFCTLFVHLFSIGQRFRAEEFQIPQHRKALSLAVIMRTLHTLIIILLFVSCSSKRQESKDYFIKSQKFFEQKNYKLSDSFIDISIKLDSLNYDAYLLKSKIMSEQKNYYEAIKILKKLLIYKRQTDTLYFLIGQNHYRQNIESNKINLNNKNENNQSLKEAVLYFDSSLKINPYNYKAIIGKSNSYHNLGEYENAITILNKSLEIFPDSLKLFFYRGVEKQQLGDKKGSLQDLNFSIFNSKLDSSEISTAYRFLSYNYSTTKKYDSAIFYISKAINYDSKSYFQYNARAEFYLLMGKKDLACEDFRKSADLGFVKAYENIKKICN